MAPAHSTSDAHPALPPWTDLPPGPQDVRLVACDMDGTLLDDDHALPADFASMQQQMQAAGVTFVPASGRQHATLAELFPGENMSFIAENGTVVVHEGRVISTTLVDTPTARSIVDEVREFAAGSDCGLVLACPDGAYVERNDPAFRAEVDKYYAKITVVADLQEVADRDVVKLAIFDVDSGAEVVAEHFAHLNQTHKITISGAHWVDILNRDANKGAALIALQEALGVTRAQTAAFGDYLNDLELLAQAQWSFAMANAHPGLKQAARYEAPSNLDSGVLQVMRRLLGG